MKHFIFLLLIIVSLTSNAQSFFKPLPHSTPGKLMATPNSSVFGTDQWNFRPIVSVTSYSIPGNQLSTGAGVAYELNSLDPATQKWTSIVSISMLVYYNVPLTPESTPANVIGGGIMLGLLNNHLLLGSKYDGKRLNFEVGTGINFNN